MVRKPRAEDKTSDRSALLTKDDARTPETFGPATLRGFDVELENFTGPFDLLLQLIARRDMDLTEVALAEVTDEFLGYIKSSPDLSSATDFLVVAATLLDMKAAALLPQIPGEEAPDEDLEARDLLFSRLLQYRAFKDAAEVLQGRWEEFSGATARTVPLEQPYASMLPKLRWTLNPQMLALIATEALSEKPRPDMADHVASITVTLEDELTEVENRLREDGESTFEALIEGAAALTVVVTRFLALLELYRRGDVAFEQPEPLGELVVYWKGSRRDGN